MGRPKGVKNGEGKTPKGTQCKLDRSRKETRIKKGLQQPDQYTMTVNEACAAAGLPYCPKKTSVDSQWEHPN